MRRVLSFLSVTICLAAVLCLGGCANMISGAVNKTVKDAASDASVSYDESNSSITVSTDEGTTTIGAMTSWPDDWPSDVPKMSGTPSSTMNSSNDSGVYFVLSFDKSTIKDVNDYVDNLSFQGYKKDLETTEDGYMASLSNDKYGIIVTFDNDKTAGLMQSSTTSSDSSGSDSSNS